MTLVSVQRNTESSVFRVRTATGADVAVKVTANAAPLRRESQRLRLAQECRGTHWAPVFRGAGSLDGYAFHVTDYIVGHRLDRLLLNAQLDEHVVGRLLCLLRDCPTESVTRDEAHRLYLRLFYHRPLDRLRNLARKRNSPFSAGRRRQLLQALTTHVTHAVARAGSELQWAVSGRVGPFPGDAHLGNVLLDVDSDSLRIVDVSGYNRLPIEYDLGKILQCLRGGYYALRRDRFQLRVSKDARTWSLEVPSLRRAKQILDKTEGLIREIFGPATLTRARWAAALHMMSLGLPHIASPRRAVALMFRGVEIAPPAGALAEYLG